MLERFRPEWAKGYSDDSVAAQAYLAATTNIWEVLGVTNQTEALQRIRDLLEIEQNHQARPGF